MAERVRVDGKFLRVGAQKLWVKGVTYGPFRPQTSGINLGKPSDSGINLESVGADLSQNESIELAPLDDSGELDKPKAKSGVKSDPSATALPIKQQAKDIFEDTDFEVDALDLQTDDNTMQLEVASDFDLEESESGSEVFAVGEDDVDQNAATAMSGFDWQYSPGSWRPKLTPVVAAVKVMKRTVVWLVVATVEP